MVSFFTKIQLRLKGYKCDITREKIISDFETFAMGFELMFPLGRDIDHFQIEKTLIDILYGNRLTCDEYIKVKDAYAYTDSVDNKELILRTYGNATDMTRALPFGMYRYAKKAVDEGKATDEEFKFARGLKYSDTVTDKITDILQRLCKDAIIESINKNPSIIKLYDDPDEDMQIAAVKKDPNMINYIKNPSGGALLISNGIE